MCPFETASFRLHLFSVVNIIFMTWCNKYVAQGVNKLPFSVWRCSHSLWSCCILNTHMTICTWNLKHNQIFLYFWRALLASHKGSRQLRLRWTPWSNLYFYLIQSSRPFLCRCHAYNRFVCLSHNWTTITSHWPSLDGQRLLYGQKICPQPSVFILQCDRLKILVIKMLSRRLGS